MIQEQSKSQALKTPLPITQPPSLTKPAPLTLLQHNTMLMDTVEMKKIVMDVTNIHFD